MDITNDEQNDILKRALLIEACLQQVDTKQPAFQEKLTNIRKTLMETFGPAELMVALLKLTDSYSRALFQLMEEMSPELAKSIQEKVTSEVGVEPVSATTHNRTDMPFMAGLRNGKIPEC